MTLYRIEFLLNIRKNEVSGKSRANLDFSNFLIHRWKKFFITTKQVLIKDVLQKWNGVKLTDLYTYLRIHFTYLLCWFDS